MKKISILCSNVDLLIRTWLWSSTSQNIEISSPHSRVYLSWSSVTFYLEHSSVPHFAGLESKIHEIFPILVHLANDYVQTLPFQHVMAIGQLNPRRCKQKPNCLVLRASRCCLDFTVIPRISVLSRWNARSGGPSRWVAFNTRECTSKKINAVSQYFSLALKSKITSAQIEFQIPRIFLEAVKCKVLKFTGPSLLNYF